MAGIAQHNTQNQQSHPVYPNASRTPLIQNGILTRRNDKRRGNGGGDVSNGGGNDRQEMDARSFTRKSKEQLVPLIILPPVYAPVKNSVF